MFEHRSQALAPRRMFFRRLATSTVIGMAILAVSLVAGMFGFVSIENMNWEDAYLNAAMLLGGMGPIDHSRGTAGKIFEGTYAIYCGIAVLSTAGVILAPVVHRFFHKLHLGEKQAPK
jgi:hypothetical protein